MKRTSKKKWKRICGLLFFLYMIILSYFLFFSERYGRGCNTENYRYNLEFLKEIRRFIRYREKVGLESFVVNILGNVFAFSPFGFLLPIIDKKYTSFISTLFISVFFSLSVELLQMVSKVGIFDVDDILLNSIGCILGYLIYGIGYLISGRFHFYKFGIGGKEICRKRKKI